MLDLVIRNGRIADGSGAPAYMGDVAIQNGRIARIAPRITERATREIDASSHVVAPGFIDAHTHYDAQVLWDPLCTSSSWHGCTTVVTGNCGFTIAPCRIEDRDWIVRMLSVVEEISLESLREGIGWSWEDFAGYLATVDARPKAINVGCYVGHSAVRRYVMGADCRRAATEGETSAMADIVVGALRAGAIGVSTSRSAFHLDGDGKSVPSYYAEMPELLALAGALRRAGRGAFELTSRMFMPKGERESGDLPDLVQLAKESGRPVTWGTVRYLPTYPRRCDFILSEVADAIAKEGVSLYPQIGCRPLEDFMNWQRLMRVFANLPAWREVMFLPQDEKVVALTEPQRRAKLRAELAEAKFFNGWHNVLVRQVKRSENAALQGRSIAEIAHASGNDPLDAFLDLSVSERCETDFLYWMADMDEEPVGRMLKDPNTLLQTDAGAHLASLCNADFPSHMLAHWVRETGTLSLEQAVVHLTSRPARMLGLTDRGILREGLAADVVIFNPDTIRGGEKTTVRDLPAGQPRLIQRANGIRMVIVNGEVVLEDNRHTGALPGRLIRSG